MYVGRPILELLSYSFSGIVNGLPATYYTLSNPILQVQLEYFTNKGKDICVLRTVMEALMSNQEGAKDHILGKNTTWKDLVEAMFVKQRPTTTILDIEDVCLCKSPNNYINKD